jgi:hypothetical protein
VGYLGSKYQKERQDLDDFKKKKEKEKEKEEKKKEKEDFENAVQHAMQQVYSPLLHMGGGGEYLRLLEEDVQVSLNRALIEPLSGLYEYLGLIEEDVQEDYYKDKESEGDNESERGWRTDEGVTRGSEVRILENSLEYLRPQIRKAQTFGDIISDEGESVECTGYRDSDAHAYSDTSSAMYSVGSDADTQKYQHSACLRVSDDAAAARGRGALPSSSGVVPGMGGETGGSIAQVNGHKSFKIICWECTRRKWAQVLSLLALLVKSTSTDT